MLRTLPRALATAIALCVLSAPAGGVVSSNGTTAFRNTSAAGLTPEEIALWDQLGTLNGFYVTPVSARHVLAASHIGGQVAPPFAGGAAGAATGRVVL